MVAANTPNKFSFSFRTGGKDGLWGLWFSYKGEDHLITPWALAKSTDYYYSAKRFFVDSPLAVDYTYCDGDNEWLLVERTEEHEWEKYIDWGVDYPERVANEFYALYDHAVIRLQKTAYTSVRMIVDAMACLLKINERITVPSEAIGAAVEKNGDAVIRIGSRKVFFHADDYKGFHPEAIRHDLEHLVFHDKTTIRWQGLYITVERIRKHYAVVAISGESMSHDIEIAGICNDMAFIAKLHRLLCSAYEGVKRSEPILNYLKSGICL